MQTRSIPTVPERFLHPPLNAPPPPSLQLTSHPCHIIIDINKFLLLLAYIGKHKAHNVMYNDVTQDVSIPRLTPIPF